MNRQDLDEWFAANKDVLESAYIEGEQPWQQSGFGLHSQRTFERWEACRRPVGDCVDRSGAFLDIGCANGFLLECILEWTGRRGIRVDPFGLDFSEKLVKLAQSRLPAYAQQMFVGNAWWWTPPRTFDFVRTELVYVPDELHSDFVARLLHQYLHPGGALLAAEYRGRTDTKERLAIDRDLTAMGFAVEKTASGYWEGVEYSRIAVVRK